MCECDSIRHEDKGKERRGARSRISVKGESDLSESIKHCCYGNYVSTGEGHEMESVRLLLGGCHDYHTHTHTE